MYLKKLIVEGFKSIADRVIVDLANDINVIMGPNGSGKSNFFECIQWILGGKSAKQLRASSMEDVIFDGGENRKKATFAEGTLVFDNTDRELEIDTDEVLITRRLTRGKGTEYFINNKPVKLKDITNLFMNKGIGKNNYAITGQNRITDFISMNPDDIRGVIEEAAGISGFRVRKTELLSSIDNYDRDIGQINAVITEIERSLRPLRKQIKNAEIYEKAKEELDKKSLFYYSEKINEHTRTLKQEEKQSELLTTQKTSLEAEKTDIENFLNEYQQNYQNISNNITNLESMKTSSETQLLECSKDKIVKENNLNNLKEKKSAMESNLSNIKELSSAAEQEKAIISNNINDLNNKIKLESNEINEINSNIERFKFLNNEIEEFLSSAKNDILQKIIKIETKDKDKKINTNKIQNYLKSLNMKDNELKDLELEIQTHKETIQRNLDIAEEIDGRVKEFSLLEKNIKSLELALNASKKNENRKKRTLEIIKLFSNVSGFRDVLFNIISYSDKYSNAIDTLHGGILYNFVVEDIKDADKCIKILKENKLPPYNFIILSKLKCNKNNSIVDINGVERVSDILSYEEEYSNLISEYFNSSFIAATSQIAEDTWNKTKQKYRISTLDGTLYSGNVMRGGYVQKDLKKLQEEYDIFIQKRDDLLKFNVETFQNIYELKNKKVLISKENVHIEKNLNKLLTYKETLSKEKISINNKIESMSKDLSTIDKEIKDLEFEKNEFNKNIDIKKNSLLDNQNSIQKLTKEREDKLIELNKNTVLLEEYKKQYKVYQNNSEEKIKVLKNDIEAINSEIELAEEALENISSLLEKEKSNLSNITNEWNSLRDLMNKNREDKDAKYAKLNSIISDISNLDNKILKSSYAISGMQDKIKYCEKCLAEIPTTTEYEDFNKSLQDICKEIQILDKKIKSLGFINTDAISEFKVLNGRYELMTKQRDDLELSKTKILEVLNSMQNDMLVKYMQCFDSLKESFSSIFTQLFNGGQAELIMENPSNPLESGIVIKATPPGKKNKSLSLLSGGEKSVTAVSFIFALLKYNPSPLVVFDEIDAALDDINVATIANYIKENDNVQYIIVSHRTPMISIAKYLYGASMNEGVTDLLSQRF